MDFLEAQARRLLERLRGKDSRQFRVSDWMPRTTLEMAQSRLEHERQMKADVSGEPLIGIDECLRPTVIWPRELGGGG